MAQKSSAQKFIARNRAPRVQIEYDVEIGNAEKKVQLPFVMGVLADRYGLVTGFYVLGAAALGVAVLVALLRGWAFRGTRLAS